MSIHVFSLPDVGEGLTEAEILRWLVRPGDVVSVNQMVVEIETAKAAVELPCPYAGVVRDLHVEEGSIAPVGSQLISIEVEVDATAATPSQRQPVLVGYGVREAGSSRRPRRDQAGRATDPSPTVRAKPLVRKLARDKGIDLAAVTATGMHGEVTRADVVNAVGGETMPPMASNDSAGERIPVRGVQRSMAEAMVQSAFTAPHVTEWVDVDMTRTLEVVRRLRQLPASAGLRITPMLLVATALIRAARLHPRINATWVDTPEGADVILHRDVHLGIAADTPRGLLVPTIRGAAGLGLLELARRVQVLIDTARAGRSTPADLTGGTITLTNVGVFGVDGGTPIINPGQTSILAMGRVIDRAWVVDGRIEVRPVMQLSFSFDHRVIDGGIASRALQSIASFLQDPTMELAMDELLSGEN